MKIRLRKNGARAWITAFLVALIALMVGLIIVWKLFQMAKQLLGDPPPDTQTNSVSSSVWLTNSMTWAQMESAVASSLATNPPTAGFSPAGANAPCTFTLLFTCDEQGPRFTDKFEALPDLSTNWTVQVQRSTNLVDWVPIASGTVSSKQTVIFSDSTAPCDRGFYRLLRTP